MAFNINKFNNIKITQFNNMVRNNNNNNIFTNITLIKLS